MPDHRARDSYDPAAYGATFGATYDLMYPFDGHGHALVDLLEELADGRAVLELGVGTGRVALPLAQRGIRVHGIDASQEMLDRMVEKGPPAELTCALATLTDPQGPGGYGVATLLAQTLFLLPDQEAQRRCLQVAHDALDPGGHLVVEAYAQVPSAYKEPGLALAPVVVEDGFVVLAAARHDTEHQTLSIQHVVLGGDPLILPVNLRYCWPSELDLLAREVGLVLTHRWAGPDRGAFDSHSPTHLSVFTRPDAHRPDHAPAHEGDS